MIEFITLILKSFAQVFLQENIVFGLLIMVGLFIASPVALLLSLIGSITGYIVSILGHLPKELMQAGVFGFNGLLIGIVVAAYVKQLPLAIVLTISFSIVGTIAYLLFYRTHIPPLTGPFVLTVWLFLLFLKYMR